jgi:hypothetical protein
MPATAAAVAPPPAAPENIDMGIMEGASFKAHNDMFHSVSELLAMQDMEQPAISHKASFQGWRDAAETAMEEVLEASEVALSTTEEASYEAVKEVGFGLLQRFLDHAQAANWSAQGPEARRVAVETLLQLPQVPQRTPAWYAQGKEVLTASEFATLFGSPRAVSQLVLSKVPLAADAPAPQTNRPACLSCEMTPFDWGVRFEPVVKQVLAARWGADIRESGRLMHPTSTHLAASPDGLIMAATDPVRVGRLVEIKCPISRQIGLGVPFEYWCQMQIQMEVTGVEECDYVEVKIDSLQKEARVLAGDAVPDGHMWLVQDPTTAQMAYAYTESEREERVAAGWDIVEEIPWRVAGFWTKTVARDRAWFRRTEEAQAAFWEKVAAARAGTYTPVESSRPRRAVGTTVIVHKEGAAAPKACLILDDDVADVTVST